MIAIAINLTDQTVACDKDSGTMPSQPPQPLTEDNPHKLQSDSNTSTAPPQLLTEDNPHELQSDASTAPPQPLTGGTSVHKLTQVFNSMHHVAIYGYVAGTK